LLPDLQTVAQKVAQHAIRQGCEDELLAEAPDEFLDPITASIMMDPVILPASGVSIDRPVIARYTLRLSQCQFFLLIINNCLQALAE
jgi:ubiquitin conjugation factor E4 B